MTTEWPDTHPAAGVHVWAVLDLDTGHPTVLVNADAPLVVLDPAHARTLARALTLAAEDATDATDHDHPQPKGRTK